MQCIRRRGGIAHRTDGCHGSRAGVSRRSSPAAARCVWHYAHNIIFDLGAWSLVREAVPSAALSTCCRPATPLYKRDWKRRLSPR